MPTVITGTSLSVGGDLSVSGSSTLGDATSDLLNVGASGIVKDAAGNIGIGVTPSAWSLTPFKAVQVSTGAFLLGRTDGAEKVYLGTNAYYNAGWKYQTSYFSSLYAQDSGSHTWYTAPSGTAGNALTWVAAMTLNTDGDLTLQSNYGYNQLILNNTAGAANSVRLRSNNASLELVTGAAVSATLSEIGNFGVGGSSSSTRVFAKSATSDAGSNAFAANDSNNNPIFALTGAGEPKFNGLISSFTTAAAANVYVDGASGGLKRSTSALKYKQDIRDLEDIDLNSLRPVRYKSKCVGDDLTTDHVGFIADEADVNGWKELVNYGENGEVEGFQYERVTALLWKKCQTLEARLAELEGAK
jgi:hypothetical protein